MDQQQISTGWSMRSRLRHTFPSGIAPSAKTAPSHARTSPSTSRSTSTSVQHSKLLPRPARSNNDPILYRASKPDCDACPYKMRCCPKEPARKIPRSIHEEARDVARGLAGTEAFEQSCRDRKRVEMLFAHLKRILRLGRLRLRGPRGAQFEFTLAAVPRTCAASPNSWHDRHRRPPRVLRERQWR